MWWPVIALYDGANRLHYRVIETPLNVCHYLDQAVVLSLKEPTFHLISCLPQSKYIHHALLVNLFSRVTRDTILSFIFIYFIFHSLFITHSFNLLLIHSFNRAFIHWLTHSFSQSRTHKPTHSLTHSRTHALSQCQSQHSLNRLVHSLTDARLYSRTHYAYDIWLGSLKFSI